MRSDLALPQISAGDLDIAVVSQLAATKLPLGDEFEPRSVKMVGFEAAFRRGDLRGTKISCSGIVLNPSRRGGSGWPSRASASRVGSS